MPSGARDSLPHLPIDAHLDAIRAAVARRGALVLVAEPGAGKTTRVPPALLQDELGRPIPGQVIVTEPRRIAARQAARRVAAELGCEVGREVGYTVRLDNRSTRATRVRFVTEGVLLRQLAADAGLAGVSAVVLDEFHERSLAADLALALLREVRAALRPDLRVIVMSATLEAEPVAEFLGAERLLVEGRAHPLSIEHLEQPAGRPIALCAAEGVRAALAREPRGDVLCFLPGVGEILRAAEALAQLAAERNLVVLALHGEQKPEEQDAALAPADGRRKVVLATNVAETSLTVPGVTCVVDTGYARILRHDPDLGLDRLELARISKASAAQRAGRAGRLGPGRALRLWGAAEETRMRERELAEVRRVDLAAALLDLAAWGVRDAAAFGWFEPPDAAALASAGRLLVLLGALDRDGAPTALGRVLARLGVHPRLGRLLVAARERGVLDEGALAVALLAERDALRTSEQRGRLPVGPSDVLARVDLAGRGLLHPAAQRAIENSADDLARAAEEACAGLERAGARAASGDERDEALLWSIFAAYPDRLARRRASGAREALMVGGRGVLLSPESVVHDEELFVVVEAQAGRDPRQSVVRQASAVRREWLQASGGLREELATVWDEARERVVARKRLLFEDLPLEEGETGRPDPVAARELLLAAARRAPERVLPALDDPRSDPGQLVVRARMLAQWMPELGWPTLDDAALVGAAETWIPGGATGLGELRALDWSAVLRGHFGERLWGELQRHAPDGVDLPTGRRARLVYELGKTPVLAVRLQELFGQADTPRIAGGRVALLLHLLAPNMRVEQITQDLASFWNNTYQDVRRDLRARYPRHSWPEDPWTAAPTSRPKRRT